MKRVVGRVLRRLVLRDGRGLDFRIGAPVMAVIRWGRLHRGVFVWGMGAAAISGLDVSGLLAVNLRMGRGRSMGGLGGDINQVIGRALQKLVLGDGGEVDSRIDSRGMVHVWLERGGQEAPVTAQRRSERAAHREVVIR